MDVVPASRFLGRRAVLAVACVIVAAGPVPAQTPAPVCTFAGQHPPPEELASFRKWVENGLLFQTLKRQAGEPLSCLVTDMEPPDARIVWSFAHDAAFTAERYPALEMIHQTAIIPGLSDQQALKVLKAAELRFNAPAGCDIDWSKPDPGDKALLIPGGTHTVTYRGPSCNCAARVHYRGPAVIGLTLSRAC